MIRLIAAIDRKQGIAKHGFLPWHIPEDESYFTRQTKLFGGNVLTGAITFRDTYHSRPLVERKNFILTKETENLTGVIVINNLVSFLNDFEFSDLWVAGGATVFNQIISLGLADELYLTIIDADFGCDQFFPSYDTGFKLIEESKENEQNGFKFVYTRYAKVT